MKNFRIVTDSYAGYEAQVKYRLFPFVWFQLNDFMGANTWNTPEQALEFIENKQMNVHVRAKADEAAMWGDSQVEVKRLLSLVSLPAPREVVWQESYSLERRHNAGMLQTAY